MRIVGRHENLSVMASTRHAGSQYSLVKILYEVRGALTLRHAVIVYTITHANYFRSSEASQDSR
jgi:hypothetical protein